MKKKQTAKLEITETCSICGAQDCPGREWSGWVARELCQNITILVVIRGGDGVRVVKEDERALQPLQGPSFTGAKMMDALAQAAQHLATSAMEAA